MIWCRGGGYSRITCSHYLPYFFFILSFFFLSLSVDLCTLNAYAATLLYWKFLGKDWEIEARVRTFIFKIVRKLNWRKLWFLASLEFCLTWFLLIVGTYLYIIEHWLTTWNVCSQTGWLLCVGESKYKGRRHVEFHF